MMPLFSKGGLTVLESLSFTNTLYAFDFDGTLSKIVRIPADAQMSRTTDKLIRQLADLVPVAIVSGRSIEDLRHRLNFKPKFLIGNHGLEGNGIDSATLKGAQRTCRIWVEILNRQEWLPGVEVEDKTFSLAIHYRRSRNKSTSRQQILAAVGQLIPSPHIIQGKFVYNLLPIGAPHKGVAILDLLKKSGMKHVLYVGDDDTDEDVFGLPYGPGQIMTVRIGRKASSHASYFIQRQTEINKLLHFLICFHLSPDGKGRAKLHA